MNRHEAEAILGTENPRAEYLRLCKQHHPDKGGDPILFHKVRDAYESLTKEECSAEHELLAQLFVQELDIYKVHICLDKMEATAYATINEIPAKALRLKQARPIAKGFLITVLEATIKSLDEDRRLAQRSIAEIKKARTLLKELYT